MRRTPIMLTLAAALLGATAALAQTAAPAAKELPPPPAQPKNFSLPEIRKFDLPNGMKVRLVQYGEVPKVTVRLTTQTGNIDEASNEVWLADVTGEMLQQGTATRSAEDIATQSALMGGDLHVNVGVNQTTIGTDVFSESAAPAVALVADVARNPRFPLSELPRIKNDFLRRLSIQRSQPQAVATEKFLQVLYPNQVYGRFFPTAEMLQSYTLDQVRSFYDRNFGAARSAIYVVGRFDAAAVEESIRRSFSDWKAGTAATPPVVNPVSRRGVYLIDRPGAVQSTLYIGLPTIDPSNPDYIAFSVMNALLGGSFGSRITSNIREQKGYTYSPSSIFGTRLRAGYWAEIADVTTNVTGPSIKEIIGEIDRLRAEPPTGAEVHGIQNYLAGTFVLRNSTREGIAAQLAFVDLYGLGEDFLRNYVQRIYAVTPADVQRIAQQYIDPSKLAIVVAGDRKAVLEQLQPYGEIMQ